MKEEKKKDLEVSRTGALAAGSRYWKNTRDFEARHRELLDVVPKIRWI